MAKQCSDNVILHKSWLLITKSICHALDYDSRMLTPDVVQPVAARLQSVVDGAVIELLACGPMPVDARTVTRLACKFGELGLRVAAAGA